MSNLVCFSMVNVRDLKITPLETMVSQTTPSETTELDKNIDFNVNCTQRIIQACSEGLGYREVGATQLRNTPVLPAILATLDLLMIYSSTFHILRRATAL